MFDLGLTEEQRALIGVVESFARNEVRPQARESEKAGAMSEKLRISLHDLGITTPVAEAYGGQGLVDVLTSLLAAEALAVGDPGLALAATWNGFAPRLIAACGNSQQRECFLPTFASEPLALGSVALYEGYGRRPSEFQTVIRRVGAEWHVRGSKVYVLNPIEAAARIIVGIDPDEGFLRAAFVPSGTDGAALRRDDAKAGKLALDAAHTGSMDFDVVISDEHLLGGELADPVDLARTVSELRMVLGAIALGTAVAARSYAAEYATNRVAFGRPISAFQGISFLLADAEIAIEAARLQLWDCATRLSAISDCDFESAVSSSVSLCTEMAAEVTRNCVQVLGGHGFIRDHPVELWYRSAATLASVDFDPSHSDLSSVW